MVQSLAVGIENNAYFPGANFLSPMVNSSLKAIVVQSLAPVRQILSKGTSAPKIFRPRANGRAYATFISVLPNCCVNAASGLALGNLSFTDSCAFNTQSIKNRMNTDNTFFIFIEI